MCLNFSESSQTSFTGLTTPEAEIIRMGCGWCFSLLFDIMKGCVLLESNLQVSIKTLESVCNL